VTGWREYREAVNLDIDGSPDFDPRRPQHGRGYDGRESYTYSRGPYGLQRPCRQSPGAFARHLATIAWPLKPYGPRE